MKVLAVTFDYGESKVYDVLASVLEHSIRKNSPSAEFTLLRLKPPRITREKKCFDSNNYKMKYWLDFVENANDDVVLLDCDMIVLHDLSAAFDTEYDIGLCERNAKKLPWNGGAVFIRNTEKAKAFMREWKRADDLLHKNKELHMKWRYTHGGMNQASLGYLLAVVKPTFTLRRFPCSIWNTCIEHWSGFDERTMILHVKSGLRRAVIRGESPANWRKACNAWYSLAAEIGVRDAGGGTLQTGLWKYDSYDEYVKIQKATTEKKSGLVWASKADIAFLARSLRKRLAPNFGICHGSRGGAEIEYFASLFPGCKVIGTELSDIAKTAKDTVQHDFNKPKDEWIGKADFVYSNALDHAFDPEKTIKVWLAQLSSKGMLIIEHSVKHCKPPSPTDPFSFGTSELSEKINEWTKGGFRVCSIVSPPRLKTARGKVHREHDTRYILIERRKTDAENLQSARNKALGHPRQAVAAR